MKWNVILKDSQTGRFQPYNIFECRDFRAAVEKLFEKRYPRERFLKELDQTCHYFFWAKIEWEIFITTWPPFVAVETYLKKKSGLDSHGFDLATRALSFEIDKQTGEIKRAPLIAINGLKNESERNEQDGIRYMLMGFFQGPRNLYQHNQIGSGASSSISVVIEASFFLHLLDGHSITQNGRWIPEKVDYREIYQKMPKRIDRWKLVRLLKKRARRLKKKH